MAKSAVEKIQDVKKKHKIVEKLPNGIPWAPAGASMVVSTPHEIYSIVSAIPKGKIISISTIRDFLAKKYGTDLACPVSTGIFINIAAHASEELRSKGEFFAPYWRVLRADGSLNPKYPEGISIQQNLLETEGFTIIQKKKTLFIVENYKNFYWEISL